MVTWCGVGGLRALGAVWRRSRLLSDFGAGVAGVVVAAQDLHGPAGVRPVGVVPLPAPAVRDRR